MQHVESILPSGKKWKLVWNDEFDGDTLDTSKWNYRLHLLQKRHRTFTNEGLTFKDSCVHFNLIEKEGHFYSQHLQTGENFLDRPGKVCCFSGDSGKFVWPIAKISQPKFMHQYGYYECRAKFQQKPGWWSAFWLQSPITGCCLDPAIAGVEIDIMENFERDNTTTHVVHWDGCGDDHKSAASKPIDVGQTADRFHLYGCHWSRYGYTFYVDGKQTFQVKGHVSRRPQFILLSTECFGYRLGDTPDPRLKNSVPDAFVVDFVRVYDEIGQSTRK